MTDEIASAANEKDMVKNAQFRAQHIGKKVQSLDEITNSINARHRAAMDNLTRMRNEMEIKQKNLQFNYEARDKLQAKIDDNKEKVKNLRVALMKEEKRINNMMAEVQENLRTLNNGRQDPETGLREGGLVRVTRQMHKEDLAAARGYGCGPETTFSVRAGNRNTRTMLPGGR
mmetsp:Transcript_88123/g.184154  ORF Transcript_88123/g.184154 Transcript_88123/m.184154 type:complete len:173 (+) Transcript_88123:142-660(+)|eukprot:CAMPEP_0206430296 /NCGR_PEP_ID=MMETSP0324_2-20121206/6736_1 /ASSEMBLY_ACC=CAM_ASM_000836 /TAXON_ID=2866 /ORGANISM="Crypthecodinium cohnii, Strain Seligo" /LENGTH=172 /DNA_ID=CAMNT_0053896109 /DNA_START=74 /DNA_END=592 /DNA_ORIENTATION=+